MTPLERAVVVMRESGLYYSAEKATSALLAAALSDKDELVRVVQSAHERGTCPHDAEGCDECLAKEAVAALRAYLLGGDL